MTQEFHISITPLGEDEYFVRTEKVPVGGLLAEEIVEWPVREWLAQARQLFRDPLIDLLEGKSHSQVVVPDQIMARSGEIASPNLVGLGQEMYRELFKDTLRDSWNCAQGIAHNRGELLQLRLGVKNRRLSSLPWEVLHAGDRPLATGTDVVFSRYQPNTCLPKSTRKLSSEQPLKILMAIAAPTDKDSLQLEKEFEALQKELQKNSGETKIYLDILRQPGREQLTQALEQGQYQVFHYAGHSNWGAFGGEICLVSNKTGLTESLSGRDLAGLLVNNGIQMAVFNSCRGAYNHIVNPTDEGAELNLAEALVKRGVPGVLAMAERIPDEVALILTQLFYRNLNQGYPIDLSLSRARQGLISAYGSHQLYWALPVLYLHEKFDGYLTKPGINIPSEVQEVQSERQFFDREFDEEVEDEYEPNPAFATELNMMSFEDSTFVPLEDLEKVDFEEYIVDDLENEEDDFNEQVEDSEAIANLLNKLTEYDISIPLELETQPQQEESISRSPTPDRGMEQPEIVKANSGKNKNSHFPLRTSMVLAPLIALVLNFGGMWVFNNRQSQVNARLPLPPDPAIDHDYNKVRPVNYSTNATQETQTLAIQQFNQNEINAGKMAVETLLEKGAFVEAKNVIDAIPARYNANPDVNFLKGRLAWELFQQGNQNSLDEAINYWEKAVEQQPHIILYQNALGFAYYTKGDIKTAYEAWLKVLHLSGEISPEIAPGFRPVSYTNYQQNLSVNKREALNAYAGIGLVMMKSAEFQQKHINLALKYVRKVMTEAGREFHVGALQKNWLWSPKARQDWDLLLNLRSNNKSDKYKNSEELS